MEGSERTPIAEPAPAFGRARWWGAGAAVGVALADTALMALFGVTFQMNGRDVTWLVAASFGSSLAILGFLLGYVVEGRRRDRRASEIIQAQIEAIHQTRARLAQSEKLAALGQLAAAIAHEVRNPLAVIRSAAQGLAENAPDDEETRRACAFIIAEIDRLTSVVTSLLAFARPPKVALRSVTVGELFDRVDLLAGEDLAAKGVRLRRVEPDGAASLRSDFDLVTQVLLGLLANAGDATPPGGEVTLEAAVKDRWVEIAVADEGPGVAPDLRERIFDPFFTTRERGTGLGLAVARQIVEAHGGKIEVGERSGGGARFAIQLPASASGRVAA